MTKRMTRVCWLIVPLLLLGGSAPREPLREPLRVAPFYGLPAPGTWIEYDCSSWDAAGKKTLMTLRLHYAEEVEREGRRCAAVEIKLTNRSDKDASWKRRRVIVDLAGYAKTRDLRTSVVEVWGQSGETAPERRLPIESWSTFLNFGLPPHLPLTAAKVEEKAPTGLGRGPARLHFAGGAIEGRQWKYEAWLSEATPFGWRRMGMWQEEAEGKRRLRFEAVAAKTGAGPAPK